jgi:hypothetical protein
MPDADRWRYATAILAPTDPTSLQYADAMIAGSLIAEGKHARTFRESEQARALLQMEIMGELGETRRDRPTNIHHSVLMGDVVGEPVVLWRAALAGFAYQADGCIPTPTIQRLVVLGTVTVKGKGGADVETICSEDQFAQRLDRQEWRRA